VAEDWRKWLNEEFHNSNYSQNVIRVIKLWRMSWAGYVARIEHEKLMQNLVG
jgi:hypothetical protein